jgi:hypothetical protein
MAQSRRGRLAAAAGIALLCGLLGGCVAAGGSTPGGPTVPAPPEATQPMRPPVPASQASFRFDQVLGVPTNQADTLAASLGSVARSRGLTLVRRGDPTATYRLLGYLAASGDERGTVVTFVWDIVDADGRRLHRVSGSQAAGGADGDPWMGVSDGELAAIAARTVELVYAWVNLNPGTPAPAGAAAI